jgi:hypothetical protein
MLGCTAGSARGSRAISLFLDVNLPFRCRRPVRHQQTLATGHSEKELRGRSGLACWKAGDLEYAAISNGRDGSAARD